MHRRATKRRSVKSDVGRPAIDRRSYEDALVVCGVLKVLAPFDPHVAGTPPLGLDLPGSDIDVLCFAPDVRSFTDTVWQAFSNAPAFIAKQWVDPPRPVVASFEAAGWQIQLYGEATPVEQQRGWRHLIVERRLLALGGHGFRTAVLALRQRGMKTEPAVAASLELKGDPYLALLDLGEQSDQSLTSVLLAAGFHSAAVS
jgi:Domain of unknown function (DUF4269)